MACASSQACAALGNASKLALTSARSAPWRTMSPPRAAARDEQQRIDDDGFAGAGLAGQRRQAGFEFEFRLIDQHEIAQLKVGEHSGLLDVPRIMGAVRRRGPNAALSAAAGSSRSPADAAA